MPAKKPPVTPVANLFRHIKPTWRSYIDSVRLAANDDDDDMKSIIEHYDALTNREKKTITPEQLCELSDVKISDLVGAVCAKRYEMGKSEVQLITAEFMGPVVLRTATIAASKSKFAGKEREMFLKGGGFLPTPHGASINIDASQKTLNAPGRPEMLALPGIEDDMLEIEERETRMLSAGKAVREESCG